MQFGYFDDEKKEYVITRPDTPRSWSNYLGSTEYGAIVTNNAGGYSFYKSGYHGRFMRFRYNALPADQPGRYLYLHDHENKDYWSASWQPVGKPLDKYKSECRHGSGYTIISSEYSDIKTETLYFVPSEKLYEVWKIKISNHSGKKRNLSLFTFLEYAGNWNMLDDLLNIQYVMYTPVMQVHGNIIDHGTNVYIPEMPEKFTEKDQGRHTFMAVSGGEVLGYDTDVETFLGAYRTFANPQVVEEGKCRNTVMAGDNVCGTFQIGVNLEAGETKEIVVLVGIGKALEEGKKALEEMSDPKIVENELNKVKSYWHNRMKGMTEIMTPDADFNSMLNMWSQYNSLITFAWSRSASLVYSGDRAGFGYRDSVQDFMGVYHNIPDEARERLELMLTGQFSTGGALPVVIPFSHNPGNEPLLNENHYRSDDCMWLFNAVPAYVKESGDLSFYKKVLPFADQGEATVTGHLRRAIEFNMERSGQHGLPCGLHADWNDCLRFGHTGETVFVAMQLRLAFNEYIEICSMLKMDEEVHWATENLEKLDQNIQKFAWDGEWFMRGLRADGYKFGSHESEEGQIFLNPQVWAVISGAATGYQAKLIMEKVYERLSTPYGLMICDPPYTKSDHKIVLAMLMHTGMKENGGIFIHTQGWGVMAEAILGNGNRAFEYFKNYLPAAYNEKAEIRQIEPYVYCQSTHSKYSPRFGNSRIPWLSGSATWSLHAAAHYIMGLQPEYSGIRIDPCIPETWKSFSVKRIFRGKALDIHVSNPESVQKGVQSIVLNGKKLDGNLIPVELMQDSNTVEVIMG